jgi:hypothetical protein
MELEALELDPVYSGKGRPNRARAGRDGGKRTIVVFLRTGWCASFLRVEHLSTGGGRGLAVALTVFARPIALVNRQSCDID